MKEDMLRVIYIVTTVDGYGADKSILNNIIYLKDHKMVDPFVVIPRSGPIDEQLADNGIPYAVCDHRSWFTGHRWFISRRTKRCAKSIFNRAQAFILARKLKEYGACDLVHTNTMTTNFGIHLSNYMGAKHIMHIRELPIEQFGWNYEYGERPTLQFIDSNSSAVIANSEYVANKFRPYLSAVRVLHNGVFGKGLTENPNKYNFSCGMRMISAGRLSEDKGQMVAITAMKHLREMGVSSSDVCLDIYGDGELKDEYVECIKRNELNAFINMVPFDSNLNEKMKDYHIGLICSRCEAFGRTTVEFMGNGLAVIGNDTGNTPYLLKDGETGLIAKFGDSEDLTMKIRLLISNKELVSQYGKKGFETVLHGFSIEASSRQLMDIYESVV
jgi:glycosyltransferase involved in cell wall biosynthesis